MRTIISILLLCIAPLSLFAKGSKPRHQNDTASYARGRSALVITGRPDLSGFDYINCGNLYVTMIPTYSYMVLKRTEVRAGLYSYYSTNNREGQYWNQWRYGADFQLRYYTRNTKWFAGAEYTLLRLHLRSNDRAEAVNNSDATINNISALVGYSRTIRKNAGRFNGLISWEISQHLTLAQFAYPSNSLYAWMMSGDRLISVKYHIPVKH